MRRAWERRKVHASAGDRIIVVVQRLMNDASISRLAEASTDKPLNELPTRTIVGAVRDQADQLSAHAARLFLDHDALITLSAPGEATRLEEGPGSGVMSMPWSLCGLPTMSLPLLRGTNGLPIGVQLIGRRGGDRGLLRAAAWLTDATTTPNDVSSHEQA